MSRLGLVVRAVCGAALAAGAASVIAAFSAYGGPQGAIATPVPEATACVSDPARPDGADGCEQDPMVVCLSDHHLADQATDPATKRAFSDDAAAYCADAVHSVGR